MTKTRTFEGSPTSDWARCIDRWAKDLASQGLSDHTITRHVSHTRRMADAMAGFTSHPVAVTVAELADYLEGRRWAPITYRNNVKSLRVFFAWLTASHGLAVNPAAAISLDPPNAEAMRHLSRVHPEQSASGPAPLPVPVAWAAWIDAWTRYARAAGLPATTQKTRVTHLRRLARDLDPTTPASVSVEDLVDWMSTYEWARETRRGHRSTLRVFFTWAASTGRRDDNPALRLPVVKVGHVLPRPISEMDYTDALAAASDRNRLMLRLAAELGLRRAEVAGLHSNDLFLLSSGAYALTVRGKGNRTRIMPVTADLARELRARPPGYVFPGNYQGGHLSPEYVGKCISALLVDQHSMHSLRHRFATRAYCETGDLLSLQQLLGHASPTTTQRYVALDADRLRAIVERTGTPPPPVHGW